MTVDLPDKREEYARVSFKYSEDIPIEKFRRVEFYFISLYQLIYTAIIYIKIILKLYWHHYSFANYVW